MSGVFVSHAFHDQPVVDEFVDVVVRLGCGVSPDEIFYSSGEDTGVPSGSDLLSHVRTKVGEANLVVAVVSPAFQSRPVCVAELGAAWSRVDNLFPLAMPGMKRTDLEGVLEGMAVRYLDDGAALDEFHDRVRDDLGARVKGATWGRYKAKWLANVARLVAALPETKSISLAELDGLKRDLEGARAALIESEEQRVEALEQIEELSKTRPAETVRRVRRPKNDVAQFELLQREALEALRDLPAIVQEAIWHELSHGEMPWPDGFEDRYRSDDAQSAFDDGLLSESGNDQLVPNTDFVTVADASFAVHELLAFLQDPSGQFEEWFRREYGMPPDLRKRAVWDRLLRK